MWTVVFFVVAPALLLAVPVLVFVTEIVAACLKTSSSAASSMERSRRVAIVVPAHNESAGLLPTLCDLQVQMRPGDRLIVIADNCTDDTAEVAAAQGVEVVVRNDTNLVGKGYALAAGIAHLDENPPDLVLFSDADCRIEASLIDRLAKVSSSTNRPAQACYLMRPSPQSTTDQTLAEFAWMLKNKVRPLGLHRLGQPCQLMGTGMMFPWTLIRSAPLASGNLVEDLQLGLDLALKRRAPLFVSDAVTTSIFPSSTSGAATQRHRWIQGHLATILNQAPRLMATSLRQADLNLFVLTLDLSVPPLMLLIAMTGGAWLLAAVGIAAGLPTLTLLPASLDLVLLSCALILVWFRFGSGLSNRPILSALARQIVSKLGIYWQMARGHRANSWVRTQRQISKKIHHGDVEPDDVH